MKRKNLLASVLTFVIAMLVPAVGAQASHIMGGSMDLRVVDDRLQGTVTYSERDDCTVGEDAFALTVTFTDPSGNQGSVEVPTTYVRCIPGQITMSGSFDLDIETDIFPFDQPLVIEDGVYRAEYEAAAESTGSRTAARTRASPLR